MLRQAFTACGIAIAIAAGASTATVVARAATNPRHDGGFGRVAFVDPLNPPSIRRLAPAARRRFALGHAVFNTNWVPAGTPGASERDGLGPFYDATSCDECHNEGAHGRGPYGDGAAPTALVIELGAPAHTGGDPRYGHVLTTAALGELRPEAIVTIKYRGLTGHYADGQIWHLRTPRYVLSALAYGPLASDTIVEPRLAPQIFGVGLLATVIDAPRARFGWQDTEQSIGARTALAFAREMGLTSRREPSDDCTIAEIGCRTAPDGGQPEVADRLFAALIAFQRELPVPEPAAAPADAPAMRELFLSIGCEVCHTSPLTAIVRRSGLPPTRVSIDPYSDLRLHDLGPGLDDHDVAGRAVPSRFRTAPLWGIAYRLRHEQPATFLHDGRARSVQEAILWHHGEAASARRAFLALPTDQRQTLLRWIEAL